MKVSDDPFEASMEAQEFTGARTYFGQVTGVDMYFAILERGRGKVLFDPSKHSRDNRVTAWQIDISTLPSAPNQFTTTRNGIAESAEWTKTVKKSIQAIGVSSPRDLKGKYVQYQLVGTGRKYTSQSGEEKEATTIKFVELYATASEAEVAAARFFSSARQGGNAAGTANGSVPFQPDPPSPEVATLALFLPTLWTASGRDADKFKETLAAAPINGVFTMDSPEVKAAMAA